MEQVWKPDVDASRVERGPYPAPGDEALILADLRLCDGSYVRIVKGKAWRGRVVAAWVWPAGHDGRALLRWHESLGEAERSYGHPGPCPEDRVRGRCERTRTHAAPSGRADNAARLVRPWEVVA